MYDYKWVPSTVEYGYAIELTSLLPIGHFRPSTLSHVLEEEIATLLKNNTIQEVTSRHNKHNSEIGARIQGEHVGNCINGIKTARSYDLDNSCHLTCLPEYEVSSSLVSHILQHISRTTWKSRDSRTSRTICFVNKHTKPMHGMLIQTNIIQHLNNNECKYHMIGSPLQESSNPCPTVQGREATLHKPTWNVSCNKGLQGLQIYDCKQISMSLQTIPPQYTKEINIFIIIYLPYSTPVGVVCLEAYSPYIFHIAGNSNQIADLLSRRNSKIHEWGLSQTVFKDICTIRVIWLSVPLQLVPTRNTTPSHGPGCCWGSLTNAFKIKWARRLLYFYPPIPLDHRVIKLHQERANVIFITLQWPCQT